MDGSCNTPSDAYTQADITDSLLDLLSRITDDPHNSITYCQKIFRLSEPLDKEQQTEYTRTALDLALAATDILSSDINNSSCAANIFENVFVLSSQLGTDGKIYRDWAVIGLARLADTVDAAFGNSETCDALGRHKKEIDDIM